MCGENLCEKGKGTVAKMDKSTQYGTMQERKVVAIAPCSRRYVFGEPDGAWAGNFPTLAEK